MPPTPRRPRVTAAMAARGRALSEPRLAPDGSAVAYLVRDAGGTRLALTRLDGGPELVLTTDPAPAFRGGVFDWLPDGSGLVFATGKGAVARIAAHGGPADLLLDEDAHAAGLAVSPDGARLAFSADLADIVVLDLATGALHPRTSPADFCLDPVWSPDGHHLAWHEWDVPHMPWDQSRIVVDGAVVAGGTGTSVQQPRYGPDGRLAYLADTDGYLNLHVDGTPVLTEPFEHGGPTWGPGQRTFTWAGPDTIVLTRNEAGFGRLLALDLATGATTELAKGVCTALTHAHGATAFLRSGARTPTAVAVLPPGGADPATKPRPIARGPVAGFEAADLPEPEVVEWPADDGFLVHGRLYARNPDSPLLVWLHGGPTDQRRVEFDGRLAWFLDRGWAVLVPDYRGSTGWGRAYTQALRHRWGDRDAADVVAGIEAAHAVGWGDRTGARTVVMGGSAGGFTALHVLARRPGLCRAGIVLYPVVDLVHLAATTHRYEAHYNDSLVAPAGDTDTATARSPLAVADRIRDPLLLLHGADDVVVLPEQSRELAVRVGAPVEHHEYEGEGHGWSRPATTEDELTRISSFLDRSVLG